MLKKLPVIKELIKKREERKDSRSRQLHDLIIGSTGTGRKITTSNPVERNVKMNEENDRG
ncbi:hypothetical protein JI735_34220 (plasmid) [Paenibacillus sonchi]|uniref:Uncharacterized protein n=1 Tax=Paenibacillus sonchi TaxID=373687 RepID=A0A974SFD5_9BACL|nr:hypothetical protein [Paenibacillus sonchi]QQZ64498.1 hypothetical protein JI735_34220 [Paenibacillus sonchi]